jgi:hypothetical protein
LQDLSSAFIQNGQQPERIKDVYPQQEFLPLSKAGLLKNDVANGIAFQPALLEPLTSEIWGGAVDMNPAQAVSESSRSETCSLPQLNERSREEDISQSSSRNASIDEAVQSKRSKNARHAARCQHDDHESTRLKQDLRKRNRIAAAKHRVKKRAVINSKDEELRDARTINGELKRQHLALRDQLSRWRLLSLQHVSGEGGCQCAAIQRYNSTLMSEIILGVGKAERDMATS